MNTKTQYPTTETVLRYFEDNAPAYWRISYEYPDFIGVWHSAFISDEQFISSVTQTDTLLSTIKAWTRFRERWKTFTPQPKFLRVFGSR